MYTTDVFIGSIASVEFYDKEYSMQVPTERLEGNHSITNLDHTFTEGCEEALKANPNKVVPYHAWNFFGTVWFDGINFNCRVMVHKCDRGIVSAQALDALMTKVSDQYGHE